MSETQDAEAGGDLIARYYPVIERHFMAAYHLEETPPEHVQAAAAACFKTEPSQTPRRAVDTVLSALDDWRMGMNLTERKAA